jgi:hypothetical protein
MSGGYDMQDGTHVTVEELNSLPAPVPENSPCGEALAKAKTKVIEQKSNVPLGEDNG